MGRAKPRNGPFQPSGLLVAYDLIGHYNLAMAFHHLMNMYSPIDGPSQAMLAALKDGYRLSLPIEAEPAPGVIPNSQAHMLKNGIVGVYVTVEAAMRDEMRPHLPMLIPGPFSEWLAARPKL